jgi:benzoyl-CoA reductase subunit D
MIHLTAGVDVGSSAVKVAVMRSRAGEGGEILATASQRIRRRAVDEVARAAFAEACAEAGVVPDDLAYVASTGDGDAVAFRTGHFYSMTTHARGGVFLVPEAKGVLDAGALHARAMRVDAHGRVLGHRMTSQCASGSGQFLENIARYLGVPLEDVGRLSAQATAPEEVSSICAVLAETDVINMVSRGVAAPDILRGIHLSIASRLAGLIRAIGVDGCVALTGGLALDTGLVDALAGALHEPRRGSLRQVSLAVRTDPRALFAGALGAALLGARRRADLDRRERAAAGAPPG